MHTVSETRSGEKSPPLDSSPRKSEHFPRTVLVPTSSSVDRERSGARLSSSDHYEPTSSLVPCGLEKRLLSCLPLRVRSLLVGSTVRHLGTPCVRWSTCASCLSSVFTRVPWRNSVHPLTWMNALPSSKFFHPNGQF